MKNLKYFIAIFTLTVLLFGGFAFSRVTASSSYGNVPGQYIIVFKDNVSRPQDIASEIVKKHSLELLYNYKHALNGFTARVPEGKLNALKNDPRVEFVSEDRVVFAFGKLGSPEVQAQSLPTGIDRVNAESKVNKGTGVNVAIIDTGIDLTHPDLKTNIVGGKNCSTGGKSYNDGNGHGTHVAGTVAALDNGTGVVGVAPEAKLWAVRVLNNAGSGTWSSVICGIDFVTAKAPANGGPITVVNMSLGGSGTASPSDANCNNTANDALHKAICKSVKAGVTYVVAAGNSGADLKGFVPAAYDEVIAVSALADSEGKSCGVGTTTSYGVDDTFASFSNFATLTSDLARLIGAPGVSILSTWKGGGYNTISGTSMASPHVAGAAALYIATHSGASPASVRNALIAVGEQVNTNFNNECTIGSSHTDPSGSHPEVVLRADTL